MAIRRKTGSERYLIFRVDGASGTEVKRLFLTSKGTWTARRALARMGSLIGMKAIASKLKASHPDLILERCLDKA